jgi:hypothetical protein
MATRAAPADELVVDPNGQPRQAGAAERDGRWVQAFRTNAEQHLYFFLTAVLKRTFLAAHLHQPLCEFLEDPVWMRKCLIAFRGGGKSTLVSRGLPLHCFIQPKAANKYFPGTWGVDTSLLLACETIKRGKDHMGVVKMALESNALLRALWPHVVWNNPGKDAKRWNNEEFILPRIDQKDRADPSMRAVGVDAATAGMHPDGKIEDDPIAENAANSPTVMETAKGWHRASRSLINHPGAREWSLGTLWAVDDLWQTEHMQDPSVHVLSKALIEDGAITWPERYVFTDAEARAWNRTHAAAIQDGTCFEKISIEQLQREHGAYFPLFYLNSPADASLTDFAAADLRTYTQLGNAIDFRDDPRDALLAAREAPVATPPPPPIGAPLFGPRRDGRDDLRTQHRGEVVRWRRA